MSVSKSFCVHLRCLSTIQSLFCTYACLSIRSLCWTWKCLSSRACAALVHVCLPELCAAPVLVCLQEFCAASRRVCLQESSVCNIWRSTVYKTVYFGFFFKKGFFVSVVSIVSILVRNTEINRKIFFFWFHETNRKTTKTDCVSVLSVQTENISCLFGGHPTFSDTTALATIEKG